MFFGILYGFGAATGQSLSYLATRHYVQRRTTGASLQLLVLAHIWMGLFSLLLLPFIWPASPIPWGAVALPLVFATIAYIAGQLSLVTALKNAEASRVSPLLTGKLIFTATIASILGQPVGTTQTGITALQWFAVLLCIIAGVSINFSGGRMRYKAVLAVAATVMSFACADYFINLMIKGFLTSPGIDRFHASLLTEVFSYLATVIIAIPLLKPLGSRLKADWMDSVPFAVAWFLAMVFLFLTFASVGILLGSILQCTRGLITILLGAALMYAGHSHIESHQPVGVIVRRVGAGVLMFIGISLYVLRDPAKITLNWHTPPVTQTGQAPRLPWSPTPTINCSVPGMSAKHA